MDFQYDDSSGDTKLSSGYNVGISVTESDDSGGGVSLVLVGGLVVLVPAIGGLYYWSRE
jgi:sialidase-1